MSGDGATLVLRVVASLLVVLCLAWIAARLARKAGVRGEGVGIKVVDRVGLTRETAIAVVEVAGRGLVLGTSAHGVTVLAELDPAQLAAARREHRAEGRSEGRGSGGTAGRSGRSGRSGVTVTRVVAPGASQGSEPGAARVPAQRPVQGSVQRPAQRPAQRPVQQGTGSVLDPRTWKQGLEALRELTVRRG